MALRNHTPRRLIIYSRCEVRQAEMATRLDRPDVLRFRLGDVRDRDRLAMAIERSCDGIIHAAALKRIDAVAHDPEEAIKTNVLGTINVIRVAIDMGIPKVMFLSSDKSVNAQNFYGSTKFMAEQYAVAANVYASSRNVRVSCTRWGNVIGSRGSVVQIFQNAREHGLPLPITDPACTRFWLTLEEAVVILVKALRLMSGGEIFVPRLPSMRLIDLAEAVAPGHPRCFVGLRPGGEKIHEVLINLEEIRRTVAVNDSLWAINPAIHPWRIDVPWSGQPAQEGLSYTSDANDWWLSVQDMQKMLDLPSTTK